MTAILEKGGGSFQGTKMLLCENPLPPLEEAVAAAQAELPLSNYYTEPYSEPLRRLLAEQIGVPSELILRQLFDRARPAGSPADADLPAVSRNREALYRNNIETRRRFRVRPVEA
jgi:hypothetical protein